MCAESAVDNIYRPFVPPADEVVARTREIEAAMAGERVPESAWSSFFSAGCEPIAPAHFHRMFSARQAAVTYLAISTTARQRPRSRTGFRCIPD